MVATIHGPVSHWYAPAVRRDLARYWRDHLALRVSRADRGPDLHAALWELGREHGRTVQRLQEYYLVPASWLPEILDRVQGEEGKLVIRRLPGAPRPRPEKPRSKTLTAAFVGGPLDGQVRPRNANGSWAAYLDEQGEPVPVQEGDLEFSRAHGRRLSRFYLKHLFERTSGPREVIYVHASALRDGWTSTKWKETRS